MVTCLSTLDVCSVGDVIHYFIVCWLAYCVVAVRALRDYVSSPFAHHWLASYRTNGLGVAGLRIGSGT